MRRCVCIQQPIILIIAKTYIETRGDLACKLRQGKWILRATYSAHIKLRVSAVSKRHIKML